LNDLDYSIIFLTALDITAPADTVTQNTAAADQMEEESMSLSDNTGEIQWIIIILDFVM